MRYQREERLGFVELIKNLPLTVTGLRDYNEAIITKGGVSVKEVNPSTMESNWCRDCILQVRYWIWML